jgi:hypothetical protein
VRLRRERLCWGFLSGEFFIACFLLQWGGLALAVMMVGTMLTCCFCFYRIAFMVSFGFSLAGVIRDARGGYQAVEGERNKSGRLERTKGRDLV